MSEYIKFSCERVATEITSFGGLPELDAYRGKLLDLRLIGVDPNGIGFRSEEHTSELQSP